MQSLLRWGVENASDEPGRKVEPRQDLDPGIIDLILGKPDSVQMKESLEIALDDTKDEDVRVTALDNLEMFVEQIDNANNLAPLNMWTPLISLISSTSHPMQLNALWVLGTAIQNNPSAQAAFLSRDPLPTLFSILSQHGSPEVRSKALYCISGALRHNLGAVQRIEELGGWEVLKLALDDPNLPLRRKVAFLFNSLLVPSSPSDAPSPHVATLTSTAPLTRKALVKHGILNTLLIAANSGGQDEDLKEKLLRVLVMYVEGGGAWPDDKTKAEVRALINSHANDNEAFGMTAKDWNALKQSI